MPASTIKQEAVLEAIKVLNEFNQLEPDLCFQLMTTRYSVSDELANDHPTIQARKGIAPDLATMSILGLINGLFGVDEDDGWGLISAQIDFQTHTVDFFYPTYEADGTRSNSKNYEPSYSN